MISAEYDALMADAKGEGEEVRTASGSVERGGVQQDGGGLSEKWAKMKDIVSQIMDKCYRYGESGYFNMTTEQRREKDVCTTFEQRLWDAMEWWRLKKSYTCDTTLASEELGGG
ncbi:hypothetical protein CBR_g81522 [Chara braunii]|uniref:Uncharacterized protein n=1 Tax=Chara braunii TaxID=69332 RepID=A0A388JL26_CHABU|nr:hypothetical protein CBR_g81522 [Chara braunii]|eukprot:GBG47887.1 hypothetical protein CBR_g81522 [Chara braunii]